MNDKEILAEIELDEKRAEFAESEKKRLLKIAELEEQLRQDKLAKEAEILGRTASLFKRQTIAFKIMASGEALINTWQSVTAALSSALPPPLPQLDAAARLAQGLKAVAEINAIKLAKGKVDIKGGERGKDSIHAMLMPGETVHTAEDTKRAFNFHHALNEGASDADLFSALFKDIPFPMMLGLNKDISNANNFDDRLYKETLKSNDYLFQLVKKKESGNTYTDNKGNTVKESGNITRVIRK